MLYIIMESFLAMDIIALFLRKSYLSFLYDALNVLDIFTAVFTELTRKNLMSDEPIICVMSPDRSRWGTRPQYADR